MEKRKIAIFLGLLLVIGVIWLSRNWSGLMSSSTAPGAISAEITRFRQVYAEKSLSEYPPDQGGSPQAVIDGIANTWWYGQVVPNTPAVLVFDLKDFREVSEVDINFMDRYATEIIVYFKYENDWITAHELTGNSSPSVLISIDPSRRVSTDSVRIEFVETVATDHLVGVDEVKLFKSLK